MMIPPIDSECVAPVQPAFAKSQREIGYAATLVSRFYGGSRPLCKYLPAEVP